MVEHFERTFAQVLDEVGTPSQGALAAAKFLTMVLGDDLGGLSDHALCRAYEARWPSGSYATFTRILNLHDENVDVVVLLEAKPHGGTHWKKRVSPIHQPLMDSAILSSTLYPVTPDEWSIPSLLRDALFRRATATSDDARGGAASHVLSGSSPHLTEMWAPGLKWPVRWRQIPVGQIFVGPLTEDGLTRGPSRETSPSWAGHSPSQHPVQPPGQPGEGKRRAELSDEDLVERSLRRARSMRELAEIESRRAVWTGQKSGLSQRKLGDLLGRSQPDIGRTLKKVESDPSIVEPSPREYALRRAVDQFTTSEMMTRLLAFTFTTGEEDPSPVGGGYIPGTWDQVRAMRRDGLITLDEWDELFAANFGQRDGRADLLMPDEEEG